MKETRCDWQSRASWCTDTLCIASTRVRFKSRSDECAILSNSKTSASRVRSHKENLHIYIYIYIKEREREREREREGEQYHPLHNATEVLKKLVVRNVDHMTVTRWFKKFHKGYENLDDQAKSSRPHTVDSLVVLQTIEATPESRIWRVSGEVGISHCSVWFVPFLTSEIAARAAGLCLTLPKYCKILTLPSSFNNIVFFPQ